MLSVAAISLGSSIGSTRALISNYQYILNSSFMLPRIRAARILWGDLQPTEDLPVHRVMPGYDGHFRVRAARSDGSNFFSTYDLIFVYDVFIFTQRLALSSFEC